MPKIRKLVVETRGTTVSIGQTIVVSGPVGMLTMNCQPSIGLEKEGETLLVTVRREDKEAEALRGTLRSLLNNMVSGVSDGFRKNLVLVGIGYKASVSKGTLLLSLGFSQLKFYKIRNDCCVTSKKPNEVEIFGLDKQLVSQVAEQIKRQRPSEPYKGKGIRFSSEVVRTKERKKSK